MNTPDRFSTTCGTCHATVTEVAEMGLALLLRFFIHPQPQTGLTSVDAEYHSIRGPIVSNWQHSGTGPHPVSNRASECHRHHYHADQQSGRRYRERRPCCNRPGRDFKHGADQCPGTRGRLWPVRLYCAVLEGHQFGAKRLQIDVGHGRIGHPIDPKAAAPRDDQRCANWRLAYVPALPCV
jgi:hypothetical protein